MSNPYQNPLSSYQEESPSLLPSGLPGFSLRRPSYATAASGPGGFGRSGATFQQLLNNSNADASESNGTSDNHSGSSLRLPYASGDNNSASNNHNSSSSDADTLRYNMDYRSGGLLGWPGSRQRQLPSISRAFEPLMRGTAYDGYGPIPSNNLFFTPSYLRDSVHVQNLEKQYKTKMQALHDSQQSQPLHPRQSTAAAASAAAVGGTSGVLGGSSRSASHGLPGVSSLGGLGSGSGSGGGAGMKLGLGSHRGMAFDVVEKVPGSSGLVEEEEVIAPLPSRWAKNDKAPALDVLCDGLDVKYTALKPSNDREQEASSIRADHYMPPQCGIYYFEVTVLSKKRDESTIGIGFADATTPLSRPPGWEPGSWGYHSDDGNVFSEHSQGGKSYGPTFTSADIIGCGVNFRSGTAFFTKNGEDLGIAFRDIKGSDLQLYPTVGLKNPGEHVRVNFGQAPFAFDIDGLMKKEMLLIKQQIMETNTDKLAPPLKETDLIQQLVLQFLQHDGYVETARAYAEEIQAEKEALNLDAGHPIEGINIADDEDANKRQRIRRAVLEGDIDLALELTDADYPSVLKDNDDVLFRLKCRKFIEMIRKEAELNIVGGGDSRHTNGHSRQGTQQVHQSMDIDDIDMVEDGTDERPESQFLAKAAIAYGQTLQVQYSRDTRPEVRQALREIFALLAYPNPLKQKEVAHLLDQSGRVTVAEDLNSAILQSLGKSSRAAFETLYAQTSVLLDDLRQDGGPGSFITVQSVIRDIPSSTLE